MEFKVPAIPVSQPRQRHRIVKGKDGKVFASNYTPAKHAVNDFKSTVRLAYSEAAGEVAPIRGPVNLRILFVMPRPKAMVWKTRPMPRVPHAKKPDIDNLQKSVLDALTGLAWGDDAQVVSIACSKVIASGDESPHCMVRIVEDTGESC